MKGLLPACLALALASTCYSANESEKKAYTLQSQEFARRHYIEELYTDTVIRTQSGIWDLETDTQLARGNDGGSLGTFLDFDLSTGLVLYRREIYDFATFKNSFLFEVRNKQDEVLFTKTDTVSNKPEAYFVDGGLYILSRTNDADTLELTLELHSIETGKRIWRHTPGGSPRWRLSQDGLTFVELISERTENYFHTAVAYDTLTLTELDRSDLRDLRISRQFYYLLGFKSPVGVLAGQAGALLVNENSKTLSPISGARWGLSSSYNSPKLDAEANTILLENFNSGVGDLAWAIFDSRTGERIAISGDFPTTPQPISRPQDPAISPSGQLLYQAIGNGRIKVWNIQTKTLVRELSYSNIPFQTLIPSADDRYLLALLLDAAADDFMVLIDTETNLPVYSKLKIDPDIFNPTNGGFGYVTGFSRTLLPSPSGDRFYFRTIQGFEAFDFLTGEKIEDGAAFNGQAVSSRYIASEQSWITVYESGRVRIESDDDDIPTRWIQLQNTGTIRYAAIDSISGSIAYQRDTTFFVTHPFDDREDQWVSDLSQGTYPISLHRGGKWLAAEYRGIYDLEAEEWLPHASSYFSNYAIDSASKRWARYDPNLDAIIIYNLENDSQTELPISGKLALFHDLSFSADGKQIYCLATPSSSSVYDQSIFVFEIENLSIQQKVDLSEMQGNYSFTQMQVYPEGRKVLLGRRNGTNRSVNLVTLQESLPVFIEPIYSAKFDNGIFDLSPPNADGTFCFIDEFGHRYQLQKTTAHQIPSQISPSLSSDSQLLYNENPGSEYWIQATADLIHWTSYPNDQSIKTWFQSKDVGFFKVFESVATD